MPAVTACTPGLWMLQLFLLGLAPIALLPSPAHAAAGPLHSTRGWKYLGLRGGGADVAEEGQQPLPAHVRSSLMATAEMTYSHETALEPRDGMSHMTVPQRLIFEHSFANARRQGVGVPAAQELAIRSAAEGRIIEPDASLVGKKTIMCLACQLEIPDRTLLEAHFATNWHALNLERRRAGIAPLPEHHFAERAAALLEEDAQHEVAVQQKDVQCEARRALKKASRRSAKLAADIGKLLSAQERDDAALAKAQILLDKKAMCDKVILLLNACIMCRCACA